LNNASDLKPWFLKIGVFLPIPLVYLCLCFIYINLAGSYATSGIDPEFNYLFNGVLLSHLKFHLNAIGHPGTPIQLMIAVIARVVHLFRPGQSLWDDVILNPDLYIRSVVYTAGVINATILFITGRYIYRKTDSLIPALILQLTPFAFLLTLEESYRMMPELIMPSIIAFWIMLIIRMLKDDPDKNGRYTMLFAVLTGFSLADKLTFLPFVFLPLFLLSGFRARIKYLSFTAAFFLLFAFPVLFNSHKFISWVIDLFTHKGVYGSGEKGIIDLNNFLFNLNFLQLNTVQLLFPALILIILLITGVITKKKWKLVSSVSAGLLFVFVFQFAITAKHFAFYYMTPSLLMAVFTGYLVYELLNESLGKSLSKWLPKAILMTFGILLVVSNAPKVVRQLKGLEERKRIKQTAYLKFAPILKNSPRIIAPDYYGSSSPEYALLFGLHESGRYKAEVQKEIEKHYPGTVMYLAWADVYYWGDYVIEPQNILEKGKTYTLLITGYSPDKLNKMASALSGGSTRDLKITPLAESPETDEAAFSIVKY
jgi:hypothetical protein